MFIPVENKPQWQNPPILTIVLILISVGCYFTWQNKDTEREAIAVQYYINAGLAAIEIPAYITYLESKKLPTKDLKRLLIKNNKQGYQLSLQRLIVDGDFLKKLDNLQIINTSHPQFKIWQQKHIEFKRLQNRIVKYKYGLKPYDYSLESLILHNFLHNDINHLIINMIFLFMFGFIIEMAIGRSAYLFVFLISGIASALTLVIFNPNSAYWVVGASGAIAGLVGFYTLLYGKRKIRFFYTIIIYFGYVTAPALVLLPIWVIYELINQYFFLDQVSNLSHVGGLVTGALLGFIYKRYPKLIHQQTIQDNSEKLIFKKKLQMALDNIAKLNFNAAHKILNELLLNEPNNINVIKLLYNLEKTQPETDQYHVFAHQLIKLALDQKGQETLIHNIYAEYSKIAKPSAKFTPDLLYSLAAIFSNKKYLEDAEKICHYLLKHDDNSGKQSELLLILVNALKKEHKQDDYQHYRNILLESFPDSRQARTVLNY